jgi:hypothetical protein
MGSFQMICEDFVMLGKTVPEPNSDRRVFVCSAGVSREMDGLLRIYPLARQHAPKRWTINQVPLERNPKDSRKESWKLQGDRSLGAHERINVIFRGIDVVPQSDRARLLERYVVKSIAEANQQRLSLGVIHPIASPRLLFDFNPESPESPQLYMFDDFRATAPDAGAKRFSFIPRVQFGDADGIHSLTLRDWGCFEFMRKYGDARRHELSTALGLDAECSLLIGNLNHHRTGWLVISVLRGIRPRPAIQQPLDLGID